MRIAISSAGKDWRGTETDSLLLAKGLRDRGHDIVVFCRPESALRDRLAGEVQLEAILGARDFDPRIIGRCVRALRKHRTQIVITQKDKDLRQTGMAAWLSRIPVLVRHVTDRPLKKGLRYRFIFGRVATYHLANSTSTLATLRASAPWLRADVPVIHNGIDIGAFANAAPADLGLPEEAIVVGFVGAFEMRKGITDFAEAWKIVSRSVPNAYAVIAGEGAREADFRAAMGDALRVHWLGFRRDTASVMKALDVFVMPSRFEGFGLVLAEAMAAGRACVAYATSNIPELVEDGVTGVLARAGDTEALAAAMIRLCADHELRQVVGAAAARHAAARFSADRMVEEHEIVIRACLLKSRAANSDIEAT